MSRIGENPITIPEGVNVNVTDGVVTIKGSLGELSQVIKDGIKVNINENLISLERSSNQKDQRSLHGLYRALIANMVEGVSNGYSKELNLVGPLKLEKENTYKYQLTYDYNESYKLNLFEKLKKYDYSFINYF